MKTPTRLIKAPGDHAKMSSVRSADRRKRPRSGFGTALVPLSRPPLFPENPLFSQEIGRFFGKNSCQAPYGSTRVFIPRIAAESLDSAEIAARTIRVAVAPLFHQCLKLGIVPIG